MNKRQRLQAHKTTDRHTSALRDKGRHTKGQRAPRYDRSMERGVLQSGRYDRLIND